MQAALLLSVGAYAQSGNNGTLKGDVCVGAVEIE